MKKILITGATGLVGRHLVQEALKQNLEIVITSRNKAKAEKTFKNQVTAFAWNYKTESFPQAAIKNVDTVFHLMGESIENIWKPWHRKEIYNSRVASAQKLVDALPKSVTFLGSAAATGIYQPSKTTLRNDLEAKTTLKNLPTPTNFLEKLCHDWEKEIQKARTPNRNCTNFRINLVMSPEGGIFPKLLKAANLGVVPIPGDGTAPTPWISPKDLAKIMLFAAKNKIYGPIHCCQPSPPTFNQIISELKPKYKFLSLRVPSLFFKPLGAFGKTLTDGHLLKPAKLGDKGFKWEEKTDKLT